ncbi:RNA polymerase sigma factor [Herbiconiux sp. UC225_62]|uniref:RNA polymerase sigma factor n=1 Tax=Herbiconiux sp. UC225_62 TaxID=3350168 RepID=UPI0036D37377
MGTDQFDEAAIWASARGGDSSAFAAIFDAHRDRVFGQALRLIREPHDAEDVTALVFLEAWRRRDSVRVVDASVIGWLLVTTNNVVRNLARSRRRHRELLERIPRPSLTDDAPDHAEVVGERIDHADRDAKVRSAFARLAKADQDVITLCVLEELTTGQAAAVLGVPVGTVKSRLSRAKQRFSAHTTELLGQSTSPAGGAR